MSDRRSVDVGEAVAVEIPANVLAQLESLPDSKGGTPKAVFLPWQDDVLLKYWNTKRHDDIAKIVGFCEKTCRRRVEELRGGAT